MAKKNLIKIILYLVLVLREFINILSLYLRRFFFILPINNLLFNSGSQSQIFHFEIHKNLKSMQIAHVLKIN